MSTERVIPPLRIAVLGDMDGMHTRRWIEAFVRRGHELHAISYYTPAQKIPGATLHVLASPPRSPSPTPERGRLNDEGSSKETGRGAGTGRAGSGFVRGLAPPSLLRLVHAWRYSRAGLRRVLAEIGPDVFHAHYAVEHGFYGAFAGFHPYVVSAWGSDLLVESHKPLGRLIARRALRDADLVTANDASLHKRALELGVAPEQAAVVHLGIERLFLEAGAASVNLRGADADQPTVISDRALEPLYNVDVVLRAFARARERVPGARLVVAHDGSRRARLESLANELGMGESVRFTGLLDGPSLARELAQAHVYVSVPSSDSLALSNLEAMAAGVFPVVADLPSVEGWVEHGVNGVRVPPEDADALAQALETALTDAPLRRSAAEANRPKVEAEGLRERTMQLMERHYFRLIGHPMAAQGEAI